MKKLNREGKFENLELFNDEGIKVYSFEAFPRTGIWVEYTNDDEGRPLNLEDSMGSKCKYTYDDKGNKLAYEDTLKDVTYKTTYDEKGNELSYERSRGPFMLNGKSTKEDVYNFYHKKF